MYFAENLKYLRERNHETQSELGEFLQVGKSTVCHYELGNSEPPLKHIIAIAEHYDVSVDDLLNTKMKIEIMFAENLKHLRESKKLTQQGLADILGISASAITMWEQKSRTPDIEMIVCIADFFDLSLDELILKKMKSLLPVCVTNIIYLREKNSIKQEDMAKLIGLKTISGYCKKEKGNVPFSLEEIMTIADFFGLTLDQLTKTDLSQGGA